MSSVPMRSEVKLLLQAAMAIFVVTVGIGIFNGFHITQLSRDVLLTHVHAGTLGWITLGVMAFCLWLFGSAQPSSGERRYLRWTTVLAVCAVPLYVAAFLSGNLPARAIFGVPVLLAIAGIFGWVIWRSRIVYLNIARLAVLGAITTLTLGAILGVLLQVELASKQQFLPVGAFSAHPSAMVVGYLILIGMAISEWQLMPDTGKRSIAGLTQITLPFLGGLLLTVGALLNNNMLVGLFVPLEVIAIVIYAVRFAPPIVRARWLARGPERHFALIGFFLVVNVALISWLIIGVTVTRVYADFAQIPIWLVFAFDHAMFIGVMSNAIFGLLLLATRERRALWSWADDVVFYGMNLGMIGFVLTLLTDAQALEKIFTPIMGGSILIGLLTYTLRLQAPEPAPTAAAEETRLAAG